MFLDFKQAFDTVNREFMLDTLHKLVLMITLLRGFKYYTTAYLHE